MPQKRGELNSEKMKIDEKTMLRVSDFNDLQIERQTFYAPSYEQAVDFTNALCQLCDAHKIKMIDWQAVYDSRKANA